MNSADSTQIAALGKKIQFLEEKCKNLESENKSLAGFINYSPFPYQSLDEKGNFLFVNKEYEENIGYKLKELKHKNFIEEVDRYVR